MSSGVSSAPRTQSLTEAGADHRLLRDFGLVVVAGVDKKQRHRSSSERVVIGTHESVDFRLTDPTLSRFHSRIEVDDDRIVVHDLASHNGTFVNDVRVQVAFLTHGDVLRLGKTRIKVEVGKEPLKIPLPQRDRFGLLVGRSPAMRALFTTLERAAGVDTTVLIEGETGTGKDVAAVSIHRESARAAAPFVVVDCGAISPHVMESELFGHEAGAFTGATERHVGCFEAASGGTLFLDEIGELDASLQAKLLRAIEKREVRRIGGTMPIPLDVRFIAATNRDLQIEVNARRFRSDLYYRIAVLKVRMPPLRERAQDVPLLVEALAESLGANEHGKFRLTSTEFLAGLAEHAWPGNVRELKNYLERCLALDKAVALDSDTAPPTSGQLPAIDLGLKLGDIKDAFARYAERHYLEALLQSSEQNVARAARASGIDRVYLHKMLARNGLR